MKLPTDPSKNHSWIGQKDQLFWSLAGTRIGSCSTLSAKMLESLLDVKTERERERERERGDSILNIKAKTKYGYTSKFAPNLTLKIRLYQTASTAKQHIR
jgi:hypothetical protein